MRLLHPLSLIFLFLSLTLNSSTLHFSYSSKPGRLNPLIATDSASSEIAGWIFNGLLTYDKNGKLIPELAQSYKFIDATHLYFKLKKGVTWSDGKPLTSKDIIATYEMAISPKVFSPTAQEFRFVKSVRALSAYEVEVVYTQPYYKALSLWTQAIIPAHKFPPNEDVMTSSFNKKPIGSGPFVLKSFEIGKEIVLEKNNNYFLHPPFIDKVVYHFAPDPSGAFLMLKTRKVDIQSLTPLQVERQISEEIKKNYRIVEESANAYTYLGFNLRDKKFQSKEVREALSLAINRQEIIDIVHFGHAKICTGPFMPRTFAFNDKVQPPKQNISRAKHLLLKAGYNEQKPLTFTLSTSSSNTSRLYVAQILQHQLAKVGVKMSIKVMEWQAFLNTVVEPRKFDAVLLGWSMGMVPDAYSLWHSQSDAKGGFNLVGYKNTQVDRLIELSEKTVDETKQGEIYHKLFATISDDLPYLFLYIPSSITAINKKIKGVEPSMVGLTYNIIDWRIEP